MVLYYDFLLKSQMLLFKIGRAPDSSGCYTTQQAVPLKNIRKFVGRGGGEVPPSKVGNVGTNVQK